MKKTGMPFFSIVIPTYNRPAQLTVCLPASARLDYPRNHFEVIAVDDGGTTLLDAVVARFQVMQTDQKILFVQDEGTLAGFCNWRAKKPQSNALRQ